MSYLKSLTSQEAEENFEKNKGKTIPEFEEEMPFILDGLEEREQELQEKKDSGQLSCNLDDPECEACGS